MRKMQWSETSKSRLQVWMTEVEVSGAVMWGAGSLITSPWSRADEDWGDQTAQDLWIGISSSGTPTSTCLGCKVILVECFHLFAAPSLLLSRIWLLYSSKVATGQRVLHISSRALIYDLSQPLQSLSTASLGLSASAEHFSGHGACWLNLCDAVSSFFGSPHSLKIQCQILFHGIEKSGQTVGLCGKSFSLVLVSGAVWKRKVVLGFALALLLPIHTGGILSPSGDKVLVLGLEPLLECAKDNGLLNNDRRRATVSQACAHYFSGLDPALWSCEIINGLINEAIL